MLDAHELKTPAKKPLHFPSAALAQLVADEWDAQQDEIAPETMPMMRMVSTALDRVAELPQETAHAFAAYVMSDLLCYRAEHPDKLVEKQADSWGPLLAWAKARFDVSLAVTAGILPIEQPEENRARFVAAAGEEPFRLTALAHWLKRILHRVRLMNWRFSMTFIRWKSGALMRRRRRDWIR